MISLQKLEEKEARYKELEAFLADPQIIANQNQYQKFAKEYADLGELVSALKEYKRCLEESQELKKLIAEKHEPDFVDLAKNEIQELEKKEKKLFERLDELANPQAPENNRALIVEIRAGTGGEEACLFAGDLFRMYTKYADKKGWKAELMNSHPSDTGGFKEIILAISGRGAEKHLQWESGAHRVQRVPATEASGRIHTSAATVAILYEPEEVEVKVDPKDLKIDVYRSSGPGGQSVNTTDSAVRITHIPTGIVVACQDERSQLKNRTKAMRILRARLVDKINQENFERTAQDRKTKIGTGDRSEKIRTYNFSDRRVTDHRIGFSTYKLYDVLDGEMDELMEALWKAEMEGKLS